jgi:hypothetical protein
MKKIFFPVVLIVGAAALLSTQATTATASACAAKGITSADTTPATDTVAKIQAYLTSADTTPATDTVAKIQTDLALHFCHK